MRQSPSLRRVLVFLAIVAAIIVPSLVNFYYQGLATVAVITALLALSLVVLMGFVGQVSFAQYSFAALGAFTVGSLVVGHGVSFWIAMPLGVAFATVAGILVGIPALRLRGLLLAILTVAVALFVDRFVLAPGTWDGFSGGANGWPDIPAPSIGSEQLDSYRFYLFCLGVFLICALLVWNLRTAKSGRVLRAVRDSDVAAGTIGINVAAWKLAAFGLSAAIAGLAGTLLAVADASVSGGPGSTYNFQFSVQLVAAITVMGTGVIAAAPAVGIFIVFAPVLLDHTPLSHQWFPLILGVLLVGQLVFTPDGVVTKTEHDVVALVRLLTHRRRRAAAGITGVA